MDSCKRQSLRQLAHDKEKKPEVLGDQREPEPKFGPRDTQGLGKWVT